MKQHNDKYKEWLVFASEDFLMAEMAMKRGIYNQVCFHAQQTAEKSLKAFLKAKNGTVPRLHNLIELFKLCKSIDKNLSDMKEACEYLNRFYAPTRYPDAFPGSLPDRLPNEHEANSAFKYCTQIHDKMLQVLD